MKTRPFFFVFTFVCCLTAAAQRRVRLFSLIIAVGAVRRLNGRFADGRTTHLSERKRYYPNPTDTNERQNRYATKWCLAQFL